MSHWVMLTCRVFETVLTEEQFIERAQLDPDLAECYGLFSFFYQKVILPMEKKVKLKEAELTG